MSVMDFMNSQFDRTVTWKDAAWMIEQWDKPFAIKGILSVEDAKMAVEVGASAVMISNHGGRQMDGCPAPIEVLGDIVDAVGDKIDVICEGGIQRSTHMLKALSMGAKAVAGGRLYLYALAAAGQAGVEKALGLYKTALERDMKLMGCTKISELSRDNLRFRNHNYIQ